MNDQLAIMFRNSGLTLAYGDKFHYIDKTMKIYDKVVEKLSKLKNETDNVKIKAVQDILDNKEQLEGLGKCGFNIIESYGGINITYKGIELPNFTQKILLQMTYDKTLDIVSDSIKNFFESVLKNPDVRVREQLFGFLEVSNLPILTNGNFLAYKVVAKDLSSIYDRRYKHKLGDYISMPREECDSNPNNTCSRGLHFCSKDYIPHYMDIHRGDKILMLEINPEDVVSIPTDYNFTKGRACKYLVKKIIEIDEMPELSVIDSERFEEVTSSLFRVVSEDGDTILEGHLEDILSKEALEKYKNKSENDDKTSSFYEEYDESELLAEDLICKINHITENNLHKNKENLTEVKNVFLDVEDFVANNKDIINDDSIYTLLREVFAYLNSNEKYKIAFEQSLFELYCVKIIDILV